MGVVEEIGSENERQKILLFASARKIMKSDGKSARSVYNGQRFDLILEKVLKWKNLEIPPMPPLSIRGCVRQLLQGWKYIASNDLTSFFFQIQIHSTLGNLLGITVHLGNNRKIFKMIALPMGITFSPALAQHIALFIRQYLRKILAHIDFDIVVWIDNFLVLTNTPEDNEIVREEFDKLLLQLGIAAKQWQFPDANNNNNMEALGLRSNLEQQTVKPAPKTIDKLNIAYNDLVNNSDPRSFFVFQGLVMWTCYLGNVPLCFANDWMKFVREQARWLASYTNNTQQVPWTTRKRDLEDNTLHSAAQRMLRLSLEVVVTGPLHALPPALISHTDASTEALAGISLCNKLIFSFELKIRPELIHIRRDPR